MRNLNRNSLKIYYNRKLLYKASKVFDLFIFIILYILIPNLDYLLLHNLLKYHFEVFRRGTFRTAVDGATCATSSTKVLDIM